MESFILEKNKIKFKWKICLNLILFFSKNGDTYVPEDSLMLAESYLDKKTKQPIKLSNKILKEYGITQPPINWYMSEKFDGQRALWDGFILYTTFLKKVILRTLCLYSVYLR